MKYFTCGILLILYLLLLESGCITTNYYTARTLEQGKTVMTPGVDNLILIKEEDGTVKKGFSFTPSLGVATGLPWRFETGIRLYFPYVLEANLRHQFNPRTFKWFDISVNLHMGFCFNERFVEVSAPYYKYGLTLSKEIFSVQPYVSYYLNKNFMIENRSADISDYSIICFGLAVSFKGDLIFPEWNYYKNKDSTSGYYSFGIGIRATIKKSKTSKYQE